jgi:hypothetical protein
LTPRTAFNNLPVDAGWAAAGAPARSIPPSMRNATERQRRPQQPATDNGRHNSSNSNHAANNNVFGDGDETTYMACISHRNRLGVAIYDPSTGRLQVPTTIYRSLVRHLCQ